MTRTYLLLALLISLAVTVSATELTSVEETFTFPVIEIPQNQSIGRSKFDFNEIESKSKENGGRTVKWEQTYRGETIFSSSLTTEHNEEDLIERVEGSILESINLENKTTILTPDAALKAFKEYSRHGSLSDLDITDEKVELYIYPAFDGSDFYIYEVSYSVESDDILASVSGILRASDGLVLQAKDNNDVEEARGFGTVTANIRGVFGNAKTGKQIATVARVQKTGRSCRHQDVTRKIEVFDIRNSMTKDSRSTSEFQCDDADSSTWDDVNGAYSPRNDAFRNAQWFFDMWSRLVPGVSPYRPEKPYYTIWTHYGQRVSNAAFQGGVFKFGDGNGRTNHPWTSLDMVCHEIGHLITWLFRGPRPVHDESSGMNEAYSDMLGETCDMYYNRKNNYLLGDDVLIEDGYYIRDLCRPSNVAKTYYRSRPGFENYRDYDSSKTPHEKAGLYNKVWCHLSKQWGYQKAFQVFTQANRCYWKRDETMNGGVCGVRQAALDMGMPVSDVINAFWQQSGLYCSRPRDMINKC